MTRQRACRSLRRYLKEGDEPERTPRGCSARRSHLSAHDEIAALLEAARRRRARLVLLTALSAALAAVLASALAGVLALGLGPRGLHEGSVRHAALALACIGVVTAMAWSALALSRRAATRVALAGEVGAAVPALREDLLTAVELEEERSGAAGSAYSPALVEEHALRTAARTREVKLDRAIPATPARWAALGAGAVALLHLLALAIAPGPVAAGWRRLAAGAPGGHVEEREPITGDVELRYLYPAYMRREPRTLPGSRGEVNAPLGTEVALQARADRRVERAELALEGLPGGPASYALEVAPDGRQLGGRFTVSGAGRYRFRFLARRKVVAEGPPLPIAVEPDAPPEVAITAPAGEVEVDGGAVVHVAWTASDDVGLAELALVLSPPGGGERRTVLRTFDGARRGSGVHDLDLAPLRLAEGERLLYRLEVTDGDTVSGPKRGVSATRTVKIHSEAEHHRQALVRARALWEDLVKLLGDRLDLGEPGPDGPAPWTPERLARGEALDARAAELPHALEAAAAELRKDRSVPRPLPTALQNAAAGLRPLAASAGEHRATLVRLGPERAGSAAVFQLARADAALDRELERDVLYLEQLLDRQQAADLVRTARDLAARRRELANLLERERQAPSEEGKKALLAEVARLQARMAELLKRMAELAKGLHDEHLNAEALAELARSKDALGGLEEVKKRLLAGDLDGAARELDRLGTTLDSLTASLEHGAGRQAGQNAALSRDLLAFKRQLEELRAAQERLAAETEGVQAEYRRRAAERVRAMEATLERLRGLAEKARHELSLAERAATQRSDDDFAQARDRLDDLARALTARDLAAALDTARRALPPAQRLARGLEEDAALAERRRPAGAPSPEEVRLAQGHAAAAVPPVKGVLDGLEALIPDPKTVLGPEAGARLDEQARRQGDLERQLAQLRQRLAELAQRAPVFPPGAGSSLESGEGHMRAAAGRLSARDPVRGRGEQGQALDDLGRLAQGMQEMAKNAQPGGGGDGFPLPFGEEPGHGEGEGMEASAEKVEIPGADAFRPPDAFRRDLLDAMKQGTPEAYRGEVQRYYEELVR